MSRYLTPVTHSLSTPDNLGTVTLTILGPHYDRATAPGESFTNPATGNIYTGIMNQCWKWLYYFSERNRQRKKSMCFWTTSCVNGYPRFAQTLTAKTVQCWMQSVPNRSPTVIWRIGIFLNNYVSSFDESVHHPRNMSVSKKRSLYDASLFIPECMFIYMFLKSGEKDCNFEYKRCFQPIARWHILLHTQINTHNYTNMKIRMIFLIIFASANKQQSNKIYIQIHIYMYIYIYIYVHMNIRMFWLMFACITCKSSLVPLLKGLCNSNPCGFEFSVCEFLPETNRRPQD